MSKVRVVMAELEGSDEAVLDAIRSAMGGAPSIQGLGTVGTPLAALAVVRELPPPAPPKHKLGKRKTKQPRPVVPAASAPVPADGATAAPAQVYAELRNGPMTSGQLIKRLPKLNPGSIYAVLSNLRKTGEVCVLPNPAGPGKINQLAGQARLNAS